MTRFLNIGLISVLSWRRCLFGLAIWMSLNPDVLGQATTNAPSPTGILSLAEAKRLAFERNWDLLAAKSGVDLATAQLVIATEFPNPTASFSTVKIGTHESGTALGNDVWSRSYDTIAAVSQLIEIGGKRGARKVAARAGILGAKARFIDAKRILDQGVTKAYIGVLLARANAKILTESAGFMRREADIASQQFKAGDISDSNRKLIEINAAQLELQARQAEAAELQARLALEVLMAVPEPKGQWTAAETLEELEPKLEPKPFTPALGSLRPDVLAAEADLRSAEANLKLQKALRIPDPTISMQYEHNPPAGGPPVDTGGLGVSFPLPLWNRNGGNIKAARASVALYAEALGKAKNQASADIAVAQSAYDEASARSRSYREQVAPQSAKVRESIAFAYEKGAATLLDFLNAEQTDNTIRLGVAQAMSDAANSAADLTSARQVLLETELSPHR